MNVLALFFGIACYISFIGMAFAHGRSLTGQKLKHAR